MMPDLTPRNRAIYDDWARLRPQHSTDAATDKALAIRYRLSEVTIRRIRYKEARQAAPTPFPANPLKVELPRIDTYVFTGDIPAMPIPVFTGEWNLSFDECMIAGDFHLPSCKLGYIQRMCELARRHIKGKRVLLDAGDILNGDKDSRHDPLVVPLSRSQELDLVKGVVDYLLETFDEIYMLPGNHMRKRFMGRLEQDMSYAQLTNLLTSHPSRVHLSPYDIMHLTSGGERWTITHQYQYSKNKLIKANQLAQKYQSNTVTFHQHHTAIGRDEWDRYTVVDCGGFHDQDMMAYVSLVPNTFPRMNNSFLYMRYGTAHVMSHYKTITDWSLWLPDYDDKEPKTANPVITFPAEGEVAA